MNLDRLAQIIATVLSLDPREIKLEHTFMEDLGADSLDVFQIVSAIEEECDITITEEHVAGLHTVGEALNLINSLVDLK